MALSVVGLTQESFAALFELPRVCQTIPDFNRKRVAGYSCDSQHPGF